MRIRVPYVPTPFGIVRRMLELAGADSSDILYDLGCGDGRIVRIAVKEFNVRRAVCVELRGDLIAKVQEEAIKEGIIDKIELRHEDMFETDLTDATIVTLYLLTSVNDELAPKLERELRDGARVVSHEFRITAWKPFIIGTVSNGVVNHNIYLYVKGMHRE